MMTARTLKPLRLALLAVLFLAGMGGVARAQQQARPKVAVVLSGGGAKGMAHIGVLKVLEEADMPIDIICGTSMGSLIGGLYAIGWDAAALDSLVRVQDWTFLLSDKLNRSEQNLSDRERQERYFYSLSLKQLNRKALGAPGLVKGQNLANLFSELTMGYHDSISFDSLPIPYACVATDMVHYDEVDFRSGRLSTAMRASMSIPAAFTPVRLDTLVLVDGGLRNNYPADLARTLGADYIIGVSVQKMEQKTADDFNSTSALLTELVNVNCYNKYQENWEMTDVPIRVDTEGFGAASFTPRAIDTLIVRGENAARAHWDEIIALRQKIVGQSDTATLHKHIERYALPVAEKVKISQLRFNNVTEKDQRYLVRRHKLQVGDSVSVETIERILTDLRGTLFYSDASYELVEDGDGYRLTVDADNKKASQIFLGARFDNEEKAALQLLGIIPLRTAIPATLEGTLRLGQNYLGRAQASMHLSRFGSLTLSYQFRHHDADVYYKGKQDWNVVFNGHQIDLGFTNVEWRNLRFDLLARAEFIDFRKSLSSDSIALGKLLEDKTMLSYHARLHYNSLNRRYFATRGSKFEATYAIYTTNLWQFDGHDPISVIAAAWQTNLRLGRRLTLQPLIYGRGVSGNHVPYVLGNFVGGHYFSHYVDQQMPLAGTAYIEPVGDIFGAAELTLQQRIMENNYVMLSVAAAVHSNKFGELFDHNPYAGVRLGYAYDSIIGPLGASLSFSSRTHKPQLYVNIGFEF